MQTDPADATTAAPASDPAFRESGAAKLVLDFRYWLIPLAIWTAVVGASLVWNWSEADRHARELAADRGRFIFRMVESIRLWNARHGGVYVPVDKETQPNPYLKDRVSERDITTPNGRQLTMVNPAFMTRQLTDIVREQTGILIHITSRKPLNPGNVADPWESRALKSFESGTQESMALQRTTEPAVFRYMAPLVTKPACMKCHKQQGYEVGDIRGGISVSFQADPFVNLSRRTQRTTALAHGGAWLLLTGLTLAFLSRFRRQVLSLREAKLRQDDLVAQRTQELDAEVHERRQAENRLRMLIDSSGEGIFAVDANGNCTQVNPVALDLLGYASADGLLGRHMRDLIHHSHADGSPRAVKDCAFAATYREGRATHEDDAVFWRADGTSFPVEYRAQPIFDGETVIGAVVTFSDVTERKQAEEALREKTEALEMSNQELQQFAYVASHDLREPLRMVTSYLQLLKSRYQEKLDESAEEFIGFAVDGAKRMDRLILDLLDYSRVSTHGAEPKPTDLGEAARAAAQNLTVAAAESEARIEIGDLPQVIGDESQLVRLLQNLIGNALKYVPDDRTPDVRVSAERRNGDWEIAVADNGIGIEPKDAERIFGIFQRLHAREAYEGTGIGLAVCRKIVERHGGRIWVDSTPGEGSTFRFTLPAART